MSTTKDDDVHHESFGSIQISRVSCGPPGSPLFMSSHRHGHLISLKIGTASVKRDLSKDWFHGDIENIVHVEMSEAQFAQAITSLNMGGGTPCTIKYRQIGRYEKMEETPQSVGTPESFADELKACAIKSITRIRKTLENPKLPASARRELELAIQDIESNMPFVAEQFERGQARVIAAGRAELEAAALHGLRGIALAAIRDSLSPEQREAMMKKIATAADGEEPQPLVGPG